MVENQNRNKSHSNLEDKDISKNDFVRTVSIKESGRGPECDIQCVL